MSPPFLGVCGDVGVEFVVGGLESGFALFALFLDPHPLGVVFEGHVGGLFGEVETVEGVVGGGEEAAVGIGHFGEVIFDESGGC